VLDLKGWKSKESRCRVLRHLKEAPQFDLPCLLWRSALRYHAMDESVLAKVDGEQV
jgi:hypothetical protein